MPESARDLAVQSLACPSCGGSFLDGPDSICCRQCGRTLPFDDHGILLASAEAKSPLTPAQRVGQWSLTARGYEGWRRRALSLMSGGPFSPEREWHLLFGELPFGGASVYLDNATATGYLGRALARSLVTTQAPYVVIANDLSIPMLRRAAELARRDGVAERMFFIHADSGSLPLRSGSVDGVLCGGTLNEFTESQRVLQEWARVLSPRGVVSVMLQTLASGWRGSLQRSLARLLGLTIEPADRARERFEAVFHGLRELSFGPVLFMSGQRRASTQNNYPSQAA